MTYDPNIHHRRSIRLKNYDYSSNGAYFITICTQDRAALFGEIKNDTMCLNVAGEMVNNIWQSISTSYNVEVDTYQVMPNHIHGILIIRQSDTSNENCIHLGISDVIHRFKTLTTKKFVDFVKEDIFPDFNKRIWQRNYFEHIIRSENELMAIREYIFINPQNWQADNYLIK